MAETNVEKKFSISKIYIKDISFETPNSPEIFSANWIPDLDVELSNSVYDAAGDIYEIVLSVTVKVTVDDKIAYLAEVHQAGIFLLSGFTPERLKRIQNVACVRTLYPYACAAITDLVSRGGFPQLILNPVNFGKIYERHLEKADEQPEAADA